jgi:histidinol-phosphate phosphatase family protein
VEGDGLFLKKAAVFLDRDGTINPDPGYLSDPDDFELFPRTGEGMRALAESGFTLVVISNQSGVARGLIKPAQLDEIHERMKAKLREEGVELAGIYYCPHHPDERCSCRKPSPQLVYDAAGRLNLDLASSYFVGDMMSDIKTGKEAGLRTVLVVTGEGRKSVEKAKKMGVDYVAEDLLDAARWIVADQEGEVQ